MKGQPWQDETVQALKQGYQEQIDALRAGQISSIAKLLDGEELYGEEGVVVIREEYYDTLQHRVTALEKLLARADVAFRCDTSQAEAHDYYWRTREDIEAALRNEMGILGKNLYGNMEREEKLEREIISLQQRITALEAERDAAQSNLRFYDGLIMGDGEHDKIMLARDGSVFLACVNALGMDVSGTDTTAIPDAIIRLKQRVAAMEKFTKTIAGRQTAGDTDIPLWVYQAAKVALQAKGAG